VTREGPLIARIEDQLPPTLALPLHMPGRGISAVASAPVAAEAPPSTLSRPPSHTPARRAAATIATPPAAPPGRPCTACAMTTWTLFKPLDLARFDLWRSDNAAEPTVTTSSQYRLSSGQQTLNFAGSGLLYHDDELLPFGDIFRIDLFDSLEQALQVLDIVWDLLQILSYYNPFTDRWNLDGLLDYLFEEVDWFDGSEGDDSLQGFGGNDVLKGDGGTDTAHYRGQRAEYELGRADGGWSIADRSGRDGTDRLEGIERLRFSDGAVALDVDGDAGTVARLIATLFGPSHVERTDLMGIGLALLDGGLTDTALASIAAGSGVFADLAGSHGDADFVRQVHLNVTGVEPDAAALQHYTGLLASGAETQGSLALWASQTELVAQRIDLVGLAASGIAYDADAA
jgi:hypothetical protein